MHQVANVSEPKMQVELFLTLKLFGFVDLGTGTILGRPSLINNYFHLDQNEEESMNNLSLGIN